jgi:CRISPR-associated protein Cas1
MWRVIDISGDNYFVSVKNNNLSVVQDKIEKLHCLFDDINTIILYGNNVTLTNACIQKCLEHKVPIVFCNKSYMPCGMLLSSFSTAIYGKRLQIQINASKPKIKQAWRQIITEKLKNQGKCLESFGQAQAAQKLIEMSKQVRSGDASFKEGVGARIYFENIFETFLRNSDGQDVINSALNYGYAIIRSCIARAVVSVGLNPAIGIFHSGNQNPFCLVDDLMEPIRPTIDFLIRKNLDSLKNEKDLTPTIKKLLASIIEQNLFFEDGDYAFSAGTQKYIQSYVSFLTEEEDAINIPQIFK